MRHQTFRPVFNWILLFILAFSRPITSDFASNEAFNLNTWLDVLTDPIYAVSEISIYPYPTRAGEPTEIRVLLNNPTNTEKSISVKFSYAEFGIGLPFTQIGGAINVVIPPYGFARPTIIWIPPHGGLWCIQVVLEIQGQGTIFAQRNLDVNEPLLPGVTHQLAFPVGNPLDHMVDISLGIIPHLVGWGIELNPDILPGMLPGEVRPVVLSVTPPEGIPLPPGGTVIVDVEAYAGEELIGGFRKVYYPPEGILFLPLVYK